MSDDIKKTKDGTVWWPPKVVSKHKNGRCFAYPGKIGGRALGWVEINDKLYADAVSKGSLEKDNG